MTGRRFTGPAEPLAAALRAQGSGGDLEAVRTLYAELPPLPGEPVVRHDDLRYGDHERQVLDLYLPPPGAAGDAAAPVLVFLHGGGFIRGDKRTRQNVGRHFARQGFVAVLPNYRLAPASRWPSGAEDVAAVWTWLQQHAGRYGADPARCVLAGESAGAAHVAAATLVSRFHPSGGLKPAGVVLLSGPYNAGLEAQARQALGIAEDDPRNASYFGPDRAAWAQASTVDLVDAAPFPLLIGYAELDLLQMQVQAGELFARLVQRHGFMPRLLCVPGHNHFSQGFSIGTGDDALAGPLLDFALDCVRP